MLLPHAGRPGVQRWEQGSLVTFASTGAVQPLTCCRVEFPPLGCTGRKLLSTNGSSLFLFLSEHWTGRKGEEGICQIKKGSYKPPFCSCAPPAQAAKKSFTGHPHPGCGWRESERQNQPLLSSPTPAKPTKSWRGVWQRGVMQCGV